MSRPLIELLGIGKTYPGPSPVQALKATDLLLRQGELVSVVGPSGSGKSTFLNIVGLLDRPSEGAYYFDRIDTGSLAEHDRTALRGRQIGFVFQAFNLLANRSAVDNVALGMLYSGTRRRERRSRAADTLHLVGLAHRLQTPVQHLSGGERQRVAIARALVHGPKLLICDEPTGNLDTAAAAAILKLIEELHSSGLTVLIVTHDLAIAAHGQRCLVIRDGVLTETRPQKATVQAVNPL